MAIRVRLLFGRQIFKPGLAWKYFKTIFIANHESELEDFLPGLLEITDPQIITLEIRSKNNRMSFFLFICVRAFNIIITIQAFKFVFFSGLVIRSK